MKVCKKCKVEKSFSEYYKHKQKGKNGQVWPYYDPYCKVCRRDYQKERVQKIKEQCVEYKGGACQHCGIVDHACVYDFHHIEGKDFSIGKRKNLSFERLKSELDKCELLCANCHRKVHAG